MLMGTYTPNNPNPFMIPPSKWPNNFDNMVIGGATLPNDKNSYLPEDTMSYRMSPQFWNDKT